MALPTERTISGIDAMKGVGLERAKGFWADAWSRVLGRRTANLALAWIGLIAFFAVFAPLIANGHPILLERIGSGGEVLERRWPLFAHLTAVDLLMLAAAFLGVPWLLLPLRLERSSRLAMLVVAAIQIGATTVAALLAWEWMTHGNRPPGLRDWARSTTGIWTTTAGAAAIFALVAAWLPTADLRWRLPATLLAALLATTCTASRWGSPLVDFDRYAELEATGEWRGVYTLIPWSPDQSRSDSYNVPPGTSVASRAPSLADTPLGDRSFLLGTDTVGRDVVSQLMHACRLSISIGFVSTGIAVLIGVTLGSIMGYFGGKIDLFLFRVVEIFMAIPVLFLLIVAAGVLPRNTYVMMAIIGCVTWTGAARFTRAEFLKLRSQDFVQSARAAGLPLRSILFRHMLPNGVTPVLVDASFAIAAAILAEATLSYLGLGPDGQASWGKLLSSATSNAGLFLWWLAIFPGFAIFLTVLSYNLLGEALRDAIDPKLRKAAH